MSPPDDGAERRPREDEGDAERHRHASACRAPTVRDDAAQDGDGSYPEKAGEKPADENGGEAVAVGWHQGEEGR